MAEAVASMASGAMAQRTGSPSRRSRRKGADDATGLTMPFAEKASGACSTDPSAHKGGGGGRRGASGPRAAPPPAAVDAAAPAESREHSRPARSAGQQNI